MLFQGPEPAMQTKSMQYLAVPSASGSLVPSLVPHALTRVALPSGAASTLPATTSAVRKLGQPWACVSALKEERSEKKK